MKQATRHQLTQFGLFVGLAVAAAAGVLHISNISGRGRPSDQRIGYSRIPQKTKLPIGASKKLVSDVNTALGAYFAGDANRLSPAQPKLVRVVSIAKLRSGPYPYYVVANIEISSQSGQLQRQGQYLVNPKTEKVQDVVRNQHMRHN